jgi:site-specific recombinase XerD
MNTPFFRSCLATQLEQFVALRRACGFVYRSQAAELQYFDKFLFRNDIQVVRLTQALTDRYQRGMQHLRSGTRENRIRVLAHFARHLAREDPDSFVPWAPPSNHAARARLPFIFTVEQVCGLMRAAAQLPPPKSLRPHIYPTMIGLLFSTGLRIGEAIALDLGDLHHDSKMLHVRHGKFDKERWVPLSDSTYAHLQTYLDKRMATGPPGSNTPLFFGRRCPRLPYATVLHTFQALVKTCGLRLPTGRQPCLHDLRHSFAVHSLLRWYRQGRDINALLPALATYMGHVNLESTQDYLHATAELLEETHNRYHAHYRNHIKGSFDEHHSPDSSVHGTVLLPVSWHSKGRVRQHDHRLS